MIFHLFSWTSESEASNLLLTIQTIPSFHIEGIIMSAENNIFKFTGSVSNKSLDEIC